MTNLLVSVRSADEAEAALAGGAALIDVKEPDRGSLGAADASVIAAVLRVVAGRRPVSAALGELPKKGTAYLFHDGDQHAVPCLVKWGLAGWGGLPDWRKRLRQAADRLPHGCRPVAVAYADWQRAAAPTPAAVCEFGCARPCGAFLIDTWRKDGTTLLDWLATDEIRALVQHCRSAGVPVALAGSLGAAHLPGLRPVRPEWFAVRGAACRDGRRDGTIDADRVRRLAELLREPVTAAIAAG
jgi:uncharacterized protein (UPF0264 family)